MDRRITETLEGHFGSRGCMLAEFELVSAVCEYCLRCRLRSKTILTAVAEYVAERKDRLHLDDVPQVMNILR